jgi:hypothetical protein
MEVLNVWRTRWLQGLLCSLVSCLLVGCAQSLASPEKKVEASTFWPVPVSTTQASIVPFGDGRHAWVVDEAGVYGVDEKGARSHERGTWLVPGFGTLELIRTVHPGRAWLIATPTEEEGGGEARVYLVEGSQGVLSGRSVLTSDRLQLLREQSFQSLYNMHPAAMLEQDMAPHAHLWVTYEHEGQDILAVIDAQGTVTPIRPLAGLDESDEPNRAAVWQVVPVEGGPRGWLKTRSRLYFLDGKAGTVVRGPLLTAEEDLWVAPIPGSTQAWVMAETRSRGAAGSERRLFLVEGTAGPGTAASPVLRGLAIRHFVAADAKGSRAWVPGALKPEQGFHGGLYLVDRQGRSVLPGGPLFPGQRLLVSVTGSGRAWVLTHTGDAHLLDGEGKVLASARGVLSSLMAEQEGVFEFITFPVGADELLVRGRRIVHLRAEGDAVRVSSLLDGQEVTGLEVHGQDVWLMSQTDGDLYVVSLREGDNLRAGRVLDDVEVSYVIPSEREGYGWIQALPASVAYVPASEVGASLALRGGSLEVTPEGRITVHGRLNLRALLDPEESPGLGLHWPGSARAAEVGGRLEVILREAEPPHAWVASLSRKYAPGEPPPRLHWYVSDVSVGARPCEVLFLYSDAVGTRVQLVVRGVRFQAPLAEQVWFRTAVACLLATLLILVPMLRPERERFTRRWLPLLGWGANVLAGSGLALAGLAQTSRIHFPTFVGVLCGELVLGLVAGLLSPAAFRLLSSSRPFQWLVPLALALSSTRRRLLADYVSHVGRKLAAWRHQANDEQYVSLPADFLEGSTGDSHARPRWAGPISLHPSAPEDRIVRFLTREDGGSVLIESPGGRGKSALLREVVQRLLDGFREDPSQPLPVLCDARGSTLVDAVFRALDFDLLPREVHEVLLLRRDYVVVVDGLTESGLTPEALRDFIEGRYGGSARLLLTSRPHAGFRQAVEGGERWLVAEPRRLDEQGLGAFLAAYAPGKHEVLSESTRKACQGPDGTYLPMLVRLALLAGPGAGGSIASLYELAFRRLLRGEGGVEGDEDGELLEWAGTLCLQTYWANGIRLLRYRNVPRREQLQKLLQAGVLVPAEPRVSAGGDPGQVRFFHDSMQSYLTARGLFAREHAQARWDFLWRAAADPLFTSAGSGLGSGVGGSELFELCLHVFGPEEKLRRELRRQLLEWAHLFDDDLTKRDITRAVPEGARRLFQAMLPADTEHSPRSVLEAAVAVCSDSLFDLAALYLRLAIVLWPFHPPAREEEPEPPEQHLSPPH